MTFQRRILFIDSPGSIEDFLYKVVSGLAVGTSTNDTRLHFLTILVENFALFMGHISKFYPGYGLIFRNFRSPKSVQSLDSQQKLPPL